MKNRIGLKYCLFSLVFMAASCVQAETSAAGIANGGVHASSKEAAPGAITPGLQEKSKSQGVDLKAPFVIKDGMNDFPPGFAGSVRLFEGMAAFQEFFATEKQMVWPVAEYERTDLPKDEKALRQALLAQAISFGADYVVILTDPLEIRQHHPTAKLPAYWVLAYRRARARLGVDVDPEAVKNQVAKVSGFKPGARAKEGGLRAGDVLKKVDGELLDDTVSVNPRYWSKLLHWKAGDKIKVEVDRDGKTMELEIELTAG